MKRGRHFQDRGLKQAESGEEKKGYFCPRLPRTIPSPSSAASCPNQNKC